MKHHPSCGRIRIFLAVILLSTVFTGCQPDDPAKTYNDQPTPALSANGTVPRMTMSEYQSLVQDQNDEGKLYQKLSLITYTVTEFIGGHTGLGTDNGNLAAVFPCGDGFLDNTGGVYRFLSDQSGMPIGQVHTTLGGYVAARITNFPASSGELHATVFLNLVASLRLEGKRLDFVAKRPQTILPNNNSEIFISFGAYNTPQGAPVVAGYRWHRQSGVVSYDEKRAFASAAGVNMVMFEPVEDGAETLNDPCYYTYNPGGGSGGGGSGGGGAGGTTYDDDGAEKSNVKDPLFNPGPCDYSVYTTTATGLRVSQFHLADRNEGGPFSGKSEVYVSSTLYNSGNPTGTYLTNPNGKLKTVTLYGGIPVTYHEGKSLHDVSPSSIYQYPSNPVSDIITPTGDENWIIISQGFCGNVGSSVSDGYDRVFFSFFEKDNGDEIYIFNQTADLSSIPYSGMHFNEMSLYSDDWFKNEGFTVTFNDFYVNGGKLFLTEVPGGYEKRTTQPEDSKSWFLVELF